MIRVATAFSGGLAACEFALRYENINHDIVFACEWDKYARQQYIQFHGQPKEFHKDISDLDARKYLNQVDLFVWGSPCQDLSLAGKRKGFDGEKSSLFREGARVQKEMMPKNFIFENVKGLLSSNKGADYKEVCKTFRDMGYHIHTTVMNTKDFGVPQNRERVFIIGFLDEKEYHSYKEPIPFKLETRLKDLLEDEVNEKYFLSEKLINGFIGGKSVFKERFEIRNTNKYASCLDTREGGRRTNNFIKVKSATKKGYESATENDSINFTHPDSKTRRGRVGKGVAQTLDCACNQGVIEKGDKNGKEILQILWERVCEKTVKEWRQRIYNSFQEKSLLRQGVYEKGLHNEREQFSRLLFCTQHSKKEYKAFFREEELRTMWKAWKDGYTSYRRKLPKQLTRELDGIVSKLPYETTQKKCNLQSGWMRQESQGVWPLRETLSKIQKMGESIYSEETKKYKSNIRRLTPVEVFRLQGVHDRDINLVVSDTQAYKIAGNAISVNVMQYLLKSLYKKENTKESLFDFM